MRVLTHALATIGVACAIIPAQVLAEPAQPSTDPAAGSSDTTATQAKKPAQSLGTVTVEAAYGTWELSGNQTKFRQYATPPRGFFLRELRYTAPAVPGMTGGLLARGLGADDVFASGFLNLNYGSTRIDGLIDRARFFSLTPTIIDGSDRKSEGFNFRQALGRDFGLSLAYHMDEQDQYFESPMLPLHQRTRYWEAVAQGTVGPGLLSASYTDWRYFDRTTLREDSAVKRMQLRYLWEPMDSIGIEGLYAHTWIAQPSLAGSSIDTLALTGEFDLGPDTDLSMRLRRDQYDLPNAEGPYVRESRQAAARIAQHWRDWNAQAGVREQEIERVNLDHSFVDVPRWWTFDGSVTGRLTHDYRLTVTASTQQLAGAPPSQLTDTDTLYWNDRSNAEVRIEGGPGPVSTYLVAAFDRYANSARNVGLTSRTVTAGGSWDIIPRTSLSAEYTRQGWWANTTPTGVPSLNSLVPNNSSFVTSLTWFADKGTYIWCNYTYYGVDNDNPLLLDNGNTRYQYVTLTFQHQFPAGYGLSLTFAPWVYRDTVDPQMNFDTDLLMVSGSAKF